MQISTTEINTLIICITVVFLLAPVSLVIYVMRYNKRKKGHREEKEMMQLRFESELVKTQLEVQEQTMQTIGADLHDNIGQLLSLTALTLKSVKTADPDKIQQKVDDAIELTGNCIREMRLLGKLLQGEQLVNSGLEKAIQNEVDWITRAGQFEVVYSLDGSRPAGYNSNKELILFRIMQEILNNSLKHAEASRIEIDLSYGPEAIQLEIKDNGTGFIFDPLSQAAGMGLQNIRIRSAIVGGKLQIDTAPGKGTKIHLYLPYP